MKKIPLESTIVGSYKFLFTNIVSIIGTMWFPLVLLFALVGALLYTVLPHGLCQGIIKPEEIKDALLAHLPLLVSGALGLMILSLLVRAMITVGILRHAVGEKTSTTFIYFSLGARVWRMVVVGLLAVFVAILLEIACLVVFGAVNAVLALIPSVPSAVVGITNAVLTVVAVVFVVYVVLRMFFFLPAVVVAENRIGVSRSWTLGQGNVWRMIAVLIVAIFPVYILAGFVFYLTVVPTVAVEVLRHHPQGPADAVAFLKSLLPLVPVILAIFMVAAIAITGLVLGAIGHAYKAVTAAAEEPAPVEASA